MTILGIIPARYASTRLPGKPLVDLHGLSLIERVFIQASKSKLLTRVLVATDDSRILKHCQAKGIDVLMTSSDHLNGTERCGEVVKKLEEKFDFVVNIQGDEPFIDPEGLDRLLTSMMEDASRQIGTLVTTFPELLSIDDPSKIKVAMGQNGRALYFSRSVIPFARNAGSIAYFKHIGLYAFQWDVFLEVLTLSPSPLELAESLEQLRWLEAGYSIFAAIVPEDSPGVDTPEDVARIREILSSS